MRGLHAYSASEQKKIALLLQPCNLVQTVGMPAAIDLVFMDQRGLIKRYCPHTPKNRIRFCCAAYCVLEAPAGQGLQAWRLFMRWQQGGVHQK